MGVDEFGRHEGEYGSGLNPFTGEPLPSRPSYFVGLDLGQKQDFTALSILEKHGKGREAFYHCRHLQRFKLGTSYPQIVADVRALCLKEPLLNAAGTQRPRLAIDSTGVGSAVVEMFLFARPALNAIIYPITIHGGDAVVKENNSFRVPKRELVSIVQATLQQEKLKIASELAEVSILTQELQTFQASISESGFDSYNARVGSHDDLVLSLALALFLGSYNLGTWAVSPLNM